MTDEIKPEEKDEKKTFLEKLEEKTKELKATEERIAALVERNEELAARNLLGGKSDAGIQSAVPVETPKEYVQRIMKGKV